MTSQPHGEPSDSPERLEVLEYQKAVESPGYADLLRKVSRSYLDSASEWSVGQLVQWRPNLRNRQFPEYGRPGVVIETNLPKLDRGSYLFPLSHDEEATDTLVGWLDGDFDLRVQRVEARRLQLWRDS